MHSCFTDGDTRGHMTSSFHAINGNSSMCRTVKEMQLMMLISAQTLTMINVD